MPAHSYLPHAFTAITVPALAAAVMALSTGPITAAHPAMATRSEAVELAASINTSPDDVGVAESSLYYMTQTQLNTAMSELQSLGVTQVRVLLPWQYMEPTDGTYNWTQADQLLNTAAKYGIAVDADITSSPGWASTASAGGVIPNAAPNSAADAAYAAFAAAVASRYTSKISAIEVWNEPNSFTGWYPGPNAASYTALLQAAYTAIKAADPNITVVAGVLGAGVTIGSLTLNPVTFLQQMYAAGAAGFFDALSFHPYSDGSTFSSGASVANSALQELTALRKLMNANGDAAKLIWATEYGESSADSGGQAQQAAYIQDFLNTWSTLAGVGPAFLYSLIDDAQGDNMGLYTVAGVAKQVVATIQAWIAAHPLSSNPLGSTGTTVVTAVSSVAQALSNAVVSVISNVVTAVQKVVSGIAAALANLMKALTLKPAAATPAATVTQGTAALTAASTSTIAVSSATTAGPLAAAAVPAISVVNTASTDSAVSDAKNAATKSVSSLRAARRASAATSSSTTTEPAAADQQSASSTQDPAAHKDAKDAKDHHGSSAASQQSTQSSSTTGSTSTSGSSSAKKQQHHAHSH